MTPLAGEGHLHDNGGRVSRRLPNKMTALPGGEGGRVK